MSGVAQVAQRTEDLEFRDLWLIENTLDPCVLLRPGRAILYVGAYSGALLDPLLIASPCCVRLPAMEWPSGVHTHATLLR